MHYSTLIVSAFATLSIGAPIVNKRAVFGATTYDAISISGGVAGNALSEADAVLDKLPATPDEADLDFLNEVNQVANDAAPGGKAFAPAPRRPRVGGRGAAVGRARRLRVRRRRSLA